MVPAFELGEAMKLIGRVEGLSYDERGRRFVLDAVSQGWAPGEDEIFEARSISVAGIAKTVWEIGACSWTWEAFEG